MENTPLPLRDVLVVELGHSVAAPYAGQILGDLGATVVKVEKHQGGDDARSWGPPFLDGISSCFLSLNRNKYSVTVNLRDSSELNRLKRFITEKADVVLQNLRPGSVEKLGLDGDTLKKLNERLIYCNLGAFGRRGPLSQRPGYDPLMQAYAGIMSVTGEEGRPPVRVGVSLVDMATGMWAVIGILAALHRRACTAQGSEVDVSLFESALAFMSVHAANFSVSSEKPIRMGSGAVITAPYQAFHASDGDIVIAAGNSALFKKLCMALQHVEWADDSRFNTNEARLRNKEALVALVQNEVVRHSVSHWMSSLEDIGVPCAPIQSVDQVMSSDQARALEILQPAFNGRIQLIGCPVSFNGHRPGLRIAPASLGEHQDIIFNEH
jgi:crotonobetainyl-CoA:carnitine CoA-transferase CaiB-like acyl-CoA transferase